MYAPAHRPNARKGFTLVELLVVIAIIGILAGMILGAVFMARRAAYKAIMKIDIQEMYGAMQTYKNEYGDLPPSFANANSPNVPLRTAARSAILRHLNRAFPKFQPPLPGPPTVDNRFDAFAAVVASNYQVWNPVSAAFEPLDPRRFDAASSLVFWLGGLPKQAQTRGEYIPAGFHADATNPFKFGGPRKKASFGFELDRIAAAEPHPDAPTDPLQVRFLRYSPDGPGGVPYVYFRPVRNGPNWDYGVFDATLPPAVQIRQFYYAHALGNFCVPYRHPSFPNPPRWREYDKCQIICAGMDDDFGQGLVDAPRESITGINFSEGDNDNITNFIDVSTLEDEIQ
ncbi:MAG: type II secretion system protein [Planctomycetota bacterium]|jgi:prepilin-type N-terminal cleavage/methylation domain-containing protein